MANSNNIQNIKFLRNGTLYVTREAAITAINTNSANIADGSAILARYGSGNNVKTIVGFKYTDGTNSSLTIFDTEGASSDVEALREEINAKLGSGITSANTATAQLEALSGNEQSTSAETSVEGAKRYADELINNLEYTGVTTGDGVYVTNVTEADGVVSATTATLPSVTDTAVAKKFVTAVSEDKGQIGVSRGEITSSAETVVLTDNSDGGINFEVNIDGVSIVQDTQSKKLKVADTALTQYYGDEKTVHAEVDSTHNTKTFSSLLQISATTASETNVREQYNLVNASGETIGATIKIYKDSSLYNVYLGHVDDTITSASDPTVVPGTGDTALCFIYLKTDGTYELVAVNVEEFIEENEFASGVTWDSTNKKVIGVVDPLSETFLTVGVGGFKLSGVQDAIDNAVSGLDATVTGETSGNHITISIEELDGKLVQSGLTIQENDIASATDLATLSGKTFTVATSSNGSITTGVTSADDGTQSVDLITDADKILMSGFSAENTSALSGISTSDSITTAFEKVNGVITENERTTASALTDLDGRLDVIESGYVETVKVNNIALAETNNAVNVQISGATTAVTATSGEAIVVTTDQQTGAITLGIASLDCGIY